MDDSRSVQSPGALSLRAASPSQSTQEINFACRACGGSEFRVETRRGIVVDLAKLRAFESVGMGARSGHYDLYVCTRCEASVQRAHDELRDALIGKLLFAAKHLAEHQFTRRKQYGAVDLICAECRMPQVADSHLRHKDQCHVGRVLGLLEALMQIDDPVTLQAALGDGSGSGRGFSSFPLAGAEQGGVQ